MLMYVLIIGVCWCVCMCEYVYIYNMYVCVYSYICMMWVYLCMYARVACMYEYMCECIMCVLILLPLCVFGGILQRYELVWWDPDPLQETWICARFEPYSVAIRRPVHEMIWRFVPIHTVKTRRWFGFKTASFHVSVCSYVIFLFIVASSTYMLLVLFHVIIWYIWPVWLPILFHMMSVNVHFYYTVYLNAYQRHFIW